MKKFLFSLGVFALASTFSASTASGAIPPWINKPIIIGDPKLNRDIRRPGPYTPKPKPQPQKSKCIEFAAAENL